MASLLGYILLYIHRGGALVRATVVARCLVRLTRLGRELHLLASLLSVLAAAAAAAGARVKFH